MDKIYSRFRLPRIVGKAKFSNKSKFLFIMAVILIIAIITAMNIINSINPFLESQSKALARGNATKLSNEAALKAMQDMSYQDLCMVEKDQDNNIKMMKLNVSNINKICSSIAITLQESLNNENNNRFSVHLGSLTGSKILTGRGPDVEIIIVTAGDIETNIKSEFSSAGINQTLHRIYIDIKCHVNILTAYKDTEEEIVSQVLLAEAVIVGNIPDSYYNLNGLSENDTLNVME